MTNQPTSADEMTMNDYVADQWYAKRMSSWSREYGNKRDAHVEDSLTGRFAEMADALDAIVFHAERLREQKEKAERERDSYARDSRELVALWNAVREASYHDADRALRAVDARPETFDILRTVRDDLSISDSQVQKAAEECVEWSIAELVRTFSSLPDIKVVPAAPENMQRAVDAFTEIISKYRGTPES